MKKKSIALLLCLFCAQAYADEFAIDDEGGIEIKTEFDKHGNRTTPNAFGNFSELLGYGSQSRMIEAANDGYRAASERMTAYGEYLKSRAEARKTHAEARIAESEAFHHEIETHDFKVRTRWEIKDEYERRRKQNRQSFAEIREKRLDRIERMAALDEREEQLRQKGILPPKPESGVKINGVFYSDLEEAFASEGFQQMKASLPRIEGQE